MNCPFCTQDCRTPTSGLIWLEAETIGAALRDPISARGFQKLCRLPVMLAVSQ